MIHENKLINNKNVVSLVVVLALLLIISSSVVCYIIGKNSGISSSGKVIDTIIIEEPQNTDKLPVYLTGKISYSDGAPYQGTIRLFSKMQETKTNRNGAFLFQNIVYGKHTIVVVDDNGSVITQMNLTINQSTSKDKIKINKSKTGYEINVGINIALIEINIKFDKDTKEIILDEENITSIDYMGNVISKDEINIINTDVIETNIGNKVMPEGIIVIPNIGVILSNGIFVSYTGQINYSKEATTLPSGFKVDSNDKIILPDKTIIKLDGTIIRPKKEDTKPVVGDNNVDKEDNEPISPEEQDPLTWDAPIIKQGNMRWDQLTTIDLFASNDSTIDGKIYPGVSGEYEFSIENINTYNVLFSINMEEQAHEDGNINLSYRLKYYDESSDEYKYVIGTNNTYLKPSELSTTDKVKLSANSNITYVLEWVWKNENNEEQNLKDGKLGTSSNKVHFINMKIYIENA